MKAKLLALIALSALALTSCGVSATAGSSSSVHSSSESQSNESASVSQDSASSSEVSSSASSGLPSVDPTTLSATLKGDDHVHLYADNESNGKASFNKAGYLAFNVLVDDGYEIDTIVATGDSTGATFLVNGVGLSRTVFSDTESVTIVATSKVATDTQAGVPESAWNSLLKSTTSVNKEVGYSFYALIPAQGAALYLTADNKIGNHFVTQTYQNRAGTNLGNLSFAEVNMTEDGSAITGKSEKDESGYLAVPSLTLKNEEVFTNPFTGNWRRWDAVSQFTGNPLALLGSGYKGTGTSIATNGAYSVGSLKNRLSAKVTDTGYTFTLFDKLSANDNSFMDYAFTSYFLASNAAIGSAFMPDENGNLKSLTVTMDKDLKVTGMTFVIETLYVQSETVFDKATVQVDVTNLADMPEDPEDPFEPVKGGSGDWSSLSSLKNLESTQNFTLTVTADADSEDNDSLGDDGLPNGASNGHGVLPKELVYADPANKRWASYFPGREDLGYRVVYNKEGLYWMVDLDKNFQTVTKAYIEPQNFTVNYSYVGKGLLRARGGGIQLAFDSDSAIYNTMEADALSHSDNTGTFFTPLDRGIGFTSPFWARYTESDVASTSVGRGIIESMTWRDSGSELSVDHVLGFVSSITGSTFHSKVHYVYSDIGSTDITKVTDANLKKALDTIANN